MNDKKTALKRYNMHKSNASGRTDANGNPILFLLTFEQWFQIWIESGHWHERGNKKGQYCMSRKDDLGNYEVGNVFIQLHAQNVSQAQKGRPCKTKGKKCPNISIALKGKTTGPNVKLSETLKGKPRPDVSKALKGRIRPDISARASRPCTVDGITIYASRTKLIQALGQGSAGSRSPHFRYV